MTKKEESKMCDDLNYLVNIIISRICKSYTVLQSVFRDELHEQIGQYRTKIVRQMRRQIFRQMKQKAE